MARSCCWKIQAEDITNTYEARCESQALMALLGSVTQVGLRARIFTLEARKANSELAHNTTSMALRHWTEATEWNTFALVEVKNAKRITEQELRKALMDTVKDVDDGFTPIYYADKIKYWAYSRLTKAQFKTQCNVDWPRM
jgi:hypothetical protein